jgi:hypothetical protein
VRVHSRDYLLAVVIHHLEIALEDADEIRSTDDIVYEVEQVIGYPTRDFD